jgi:hypothetical protein
MANVGDKFEKEQVNFRHAPTPRTASCAICRHFDPRGFCHVVTGLIQATTVSDLFVRDPAKNFDDVMATITQQEITGSSARTTRPSGTRTTVIPSNDPRRATPETGMKTESARRTRMADDPVQRSMRQRHDDDADDFEPEDFHVDDEWRARPVLTKEDRANIGTLIAELEAKLAEIKRRYGPSPAVEAFKESYNGTAAKSAAATFRESYRNG